MSTQFSRRIHERSETLALILISWMKRRIERLTAALDKHSNNYTALQSAPGGGKSLFLDLVALLPHLSRETRDEIFLLAQQLLASLNMLNKENLLGLKTLRDQIDSSVSVSVTYNNGFDLIDSLETVNNVNEYLAWRVLCRLAFFLSFLMFFHKLILFFFFWIIRSYLFDLNVYRYKDVTGATKIYAPFVKSFVGHFRLDLDLAFEVILLHQQQLKDEDPSYVAKTNIILCVDEMKKCNWPNILLHTLGSALTNNGAVNIVFSSLDVHFDLHSKASDISQARSASDRKIDWIHLAPLSIKSSLVLLNPNESSLPQDSVERRTINRELFYLAMMANGHPRTLQAIAHLVTELQPDRNVYLQELSKNDRLMSPRLDWTQFRFAFLGDEHSLFQCLPHPPSSPSLPKHLRSLIASGFYLNSLRESEEDFCVPRLSLIHAYTRFLRHEKEPDNTVPTKSSSPSLVLPSVPYDWSASTFRNFIGLIQLVAPPSDFGTWFEKIQAFWEAIRRLVVFPDLKTLQIEITLRDLYSVKKQTTSSLSSPVLLSGSMETKIQLIRTSVPFVKKVVEVDKLTSAVSSLQSTPADVSSTIFCFGPTNPGFDLLLIERDSNGELIVILEECRFSFPTSTASMGPEDFEKKITTCCNVFNKEFRGETPLPFPTSYFPMIIFFSLIFSQQARFSTARQSRATRSWSSFSL